MGEPKHKYILHNNIVGHPFTTLKCIKIGLGLREGKERCTLSTSFFLSLAGVGIPSRAVMPFAALWKTVHVYFLS